MHVLQVTPKFLPSLGGIEIHTAEVARRLAALGVDVTILTTKAKRQARTDRVDGVRVLRVNAIPSPDATDLYVPPAMVREIAKSHCDVVHVQGYTTLVSPLAMATASTLRRPFVLTLHSGGHSSSRRYFIRPLQWYSLRPLVARAAKVIAVSRYEAELFQQRFKLPPTSFKVIPSGLQLPEATRAVRDPNLLLSVGRLERYKGHHRVISALPYIRSRRPGARLAIVGSGPYRDVLEELIKREGVADSVEIFAVPPEDRNAMAATFARASLVVSLSQYESQGLAVSEGLACGVPALVASNSALAELVDAGLARGVPDDASPELIAQAVLAALDEPLTTPRDALPSWERCVRELMAVYEAASPLES